METLNHQEGEGKLSPTQMTVGGKLAYATTVGMTSLVGLEAIGMGGTGLLLALLAGGTAAYFSEELRGTLANMRPERTGVSVKVGKEKKHLNVNWLLTGETSNSIESVTSTEKVTERLPEIDIRKTRKMETEKIPVPHLQPEEEDALIDFSEGSTLDDDDFLPAPRRSGMFLFSEVLQDFTPTLRKIYLGTLPNGTQLFCEAKDLCHVALAGSTGGGKSSIMRMIVAQLCKAGARVLLLNPHYTRYDLDNKEDWTPFDPYLYRPAMESRAYDMIGRYLEQVATETLPKRLEKHANSQPVGKPYFIVLDELPAIIDEVKNAPAHLSKILRQGRKVGIYLIVASQDFLVKTLFPDGGGGAVRECYRTAFYVGGDGTTARTLLDMPANQVPEDELGRGTIMLRGGALKKAMMVHVPYVDNTSLYTLLGPSTFRQEKTPLSQEDELLPGNTEGIADWNKMMNELLARPDVQPERPEDLDARTDAFYGVLEGAGQAQLRGVPDVVRAPYASSEMAVRGPESTSHEGAPNASPRMSASETEKFIVAYRITGNKDRSLKEAGVNTRYREHATEIIQTRNLRKAD